jgi:hypothetical protein
MTATTIAPHNLSEASTPSAPAYAACKFIDYSRGAAECGIRRHAVWMDADLVVNYGEPDPTLGRNVGGMILSVLARHLAADPGGIEGDIITVCLLRREDAKIVEVDLRIIRIRHHGTARLLLSKVDVREIDLGGG